VSGNTPAFLRLLLATSHIWR